ncbi:MAG: dockerin type I repeat-containing protein [Ruminococcus sp.]|uniref:dockerin type I repeat-containing protein n=1 Tax=Ruminococcus sp. TaxID=41978 RepID=UPI0025FA9B9D|nr:dockerin type I repeat-containing protein [Ruminococcus sp.]MBR5682791.1 dockerin type I repeat-containing protein [Ruminococcus sp.]
MKTNKLFAAFTAIVLAAANSAFFTPAFCSAAENEKASAAETALYSTAKISVVDMETGKNIDGIELSIVQNPYGTSLEFEQWNTSEEPVKTIGNLSSTELYAVHFIKIPQEYELPYQVNFSFDQADEIKEVIIRAIPKSAEKKVHIYAGNWTNAAPDEEGRWLIGAEDLRDPFSVYVYDENGNYFTSVSLVSREAMYLPDGKYKINAFPTDKDYELITEDFDIAKTVTGMYDDIVFPDKNGYIDVEIVNGEPTHSIEFNFRMKPEIIEYRKDGCKANISIVEMYTNEPLKGVKVKVYDDLVKGDLIAAWDTTDEPAKSLKDLSNHGWYRIDIADAPEGYHIDKSTSFNFSELGDTQDIIIRAVPQDKEPNINVSVYDWSDLVVDPSDGTYEGYKLMDPTDYELLVYTDKYGRFDMTERDIHLPDGKYFLQLLYDESKYQYIDDQGYKARAVRKIFGKDFDISYEKAMNIEIKDGMTVGQPCFYVERNGSDKTNCTLELKIIDGITGKPADAAEYEIIRIDEEYEDTVEKLGLEDTRGFMPDYGEMPKDGAVTVEGLEPYVKYAVVGYSGNKHYGSAKPVFLTFDKDGETREVTVRLMPFNFKYGDVNGDDELNVADLVMLQKWLIAASDTDMKKPQAADMNSDGNVDAFDLIQLRKEVLKNVSK